MISKDDLTAEQKVNLALDLDKLFDEIAEPETKEETDEFLRECGYDPDKIGKQMESKLKEVLFKMKTEAEGGNDG